MIDQEEQEPSQESVFPLTPSEQDESPSKSRSKPKQVVTTDEELKSLQKEIMEYKDKYLRLLADNDNARKRLQKERQELTRYAIENLIVEFLQPIDNLDNALRFAQDMSEEVRNWAIGFQMILTQFNDILSQHGVIAMEALGKPFDPHQHEAVEVVESTTYPPGTVSEVFVRGYMMSDRTIRPARVNVTKEIAPLSEKHSEEENI